MKKAIALVGGILFVLAFQVQADDKADAQKLIGKWTVQSQSKNGREETAQNIKGKQVVITRDMITCTDANQQHELAASYQLDTSSKPWTITLTATEGDHKGKTMKGIARLENGDTLEVCFAEPDQPAPTDFKAGQNHTCFTLKKSGQ
jgi:uncharacterized protein (TIGR03067 family)